MERAIVDFGADTSFGMAVAKFKEHYGIAIPESAVQSITKKHAQACYEMQEEGADLGEQSSPECLIGEMDGAMIPVVIFEEKEGSADKRKWRKNGWKEARLCLARKPMALKKIFQATLGTTERAGELLGRCAKQLGCNERTKMHCLGDGALWINEQVERVFGTQGDYLIDFFHLSEYLAGASEECSHQDSKEEWLEKRQEEIKEGRLEEVIALLKGHKKELEEGKTEKIRKCLRYIENRPGQFKYKEALAADLPIGSGEIESGNRSVVQKRLKLAGAWWRLETAEWMLALRCTRMNGNWELYWQHVSASFADAA